MVRIYLIIIGLSLMGCLGTRTEYGRKRFAHLFSKKDSIDHIAYTLVDTAKLYKIVSCVSIEDNQPLESLNKIYLKFYANGRAGVFYSYDANNNSSLNPRRAEIAYYKYNEKGLQLKSFFEHPQGGGWVTEKLIKCNKDTLCFTTAHNLSKYVALDLPKHFLIYKPDW